MPGEERTDFLPKTEDLDRTPANVDFKKPEVANWAEITEIIQSDLEIRSGFQKVLNDAYELCTDPKLKDKIVRVAVILGLAFTAHQGIKYTAEAIKDQPKPADSATGFTPSPEQSEAVAGMQQQDIQEDAQKYYEELKATEAAAAKEAVANATAPAEMPQTVQNQNFEGLDTSSLE